MAHIQIYTDFQTSDAWWMITPKKKMFLLYLGGSLFALATVIFQWRCPRIIKSFSKEHEFYADELKIVTPGRITELRDEVNRNIDAEETLFEKRFKSVLIYSPSDPLSPQEGHLLNEQFTSENRDSIRDIIVASYGLLNVARPISRFIIMVIYNGAAVLTFIPSLEFTVRVIRESFKTVP